MPERGTLTDTYVAALQHDTADLPDGATRVGVVRRPTRWFHPQVDENLGALAPTEDLLDEFQERRETLESDGLASAEAHNRAWEDVEFPARYRTSLDESAPAQEALDDLVWRIRAGEDVALVCYENTDEKRCHRTLLRERLESLLAGGDGRRTAADSQDEIER